MDTSNGSFIIRNTAQMLETVLRRESENLPQILERYHKGIGRFQVGEKLEIKGSLFLVSCIKRNRLILKLIPEPKDRI